MENYWKLKKLEKNWNFLVAFHLQHVNALHLIDRAGVSTVIGADRSVGDCVETLEA
jgi:hypothetical protein